MKTKVAAGGGRKKLIYHFSAFLSRCLLKKSISRRLIRSNWNNLIHWN